jgi:SAM-dependent methyltransferase
MKKVWEIYSEKLGTTFLHPQFLMRRLSHKGVKEATKRAKGNLLDVGCGRMPYRKCLEPLVKKYVALDHPKTSKLYSPDKKPEVLADVKKMPFKKGSFDLCLFFQVLEYIDAPVLAIKEIVRVLKKGGFLIITTPFLYPIHDYPHDKCRLTEPAIKDLLKQNNLKIVKFESQGNFWEFWCLSLNVFIMRKIKDILEDKHKNVGSILYLFFLIVFAPIVIISTNLSALILEAAPIKTKRYFNYFPLNYLVVATKN